MTEAECLVRGNELVIRPAKISTSGEFTEQILRELITQGYSGNELLGKFKEKQKQVRPAIEMMLAEAEKVEASEAEYVSYDDI